MKKGTSAEQFDVVEMEQELNSGGSFIENTSYRSILLTFISFAIFQSAYVYTGMKAPSLVNTTTMHYPLSQEYSNRMASIKVRLEPITQMHKFVRMDAALTRYAVTQEISNPVNMNITTELYNGNRLVEKKESKVVGATCKFVKGAAISNFIPVVYQPVTHFDSMNISVTVETEFHFCKGFDFTYSFADPNMEKFRTSIRLILSGCALYSFIGFLICLKGQINGMITILLLLLGSSAIAAVNPINVFFKSANMEAFTPLLVACFIALFRVFSTFVIDMTITGSEQGSKIWKMGCIPFIVIYCLLEAYVGMNEHESADFDNEVVSIPIAKSILISIHSFYSVLMLAALGYALCSTSGDKRFKVVAFGAFISVTLVMTVVTEVIAPITGVNTNNALSLLLYQASHILSAIVFLFFQHTTAPTYETIDDAFDYSDDDDMAVDVDDDPHDSDGFAEEEEEED